MDNDDKPRFIYEPPADMQSNKEDGGYRFAEVIRPLNDEKVAQSGGDECEDDQDEPIFYTKCDVDGTSRLFFKGKEVLEEHDFIITSSEGISLCKKNGDSTDIVKQLLFDESEK